VWHEECFGKDAPAAAQVRVPRAAAVKGKVAVHLSGLEADIDVLRRLKHPNIVRYLVRHPAPCTQHGIRSTALVVRYLVRCPACDSRKRVQGVKRPNTMRFPVCRPTPAHGGGFKGRKRSARSPARPLRICRQGLTAWTQPAVPDVLLSRAQSD
jgi:predicted Zn-ribbon and HTH transcriptional regulator